MRTGKAPKPRTEPISVLNRIRIIENGEPLLELINEERGIYVCCDRRVWVRQSVAEMLFRAQESLSDDLHLFVFEAYRSLERQRVLYQRFWKESFRKHPDWPTNIRRREINRFVAPPDVKSPPGHCTGGAIDLTLITPDGQELDMTSPTGQMLANSPTFSDDVTPEAHANRMLLLQTMEAQGFANYPLEWWHYSYGESGWAFRKRRKACFYGAAPPPPGYEMPTYEPDTFADD